MAIDASALSKLSAAIKTLTHAGSGISDKARELMTVLYAINEGFITVEDSLNNALEDLHSGKFEKKNLRKYLKTLELSDDVIEDILAKRKQLDKLDDKRISNARDYQKLVELIYDDEDSRYDLSNKTLSVFDQLNERILRQRKLLDSTGVSLENQGDLIYRQLKAQGKMTEVFSTELVNTKDLQDHYTTIGDVIDNITAKKIKLSGIGEVSPEKAIDSLHSISAEQIKLIEQEDAIRRQKLMQFAAWASDKKVDLQTGAVFNAEGTQLFGAALKSSIASIEKMQSRYESLIAQVELHGKLEQSVLDTLTDTEYAFIKQAAVAKQELSIWKSRLSTSEQNLKLLVKFRPAMVSAQAAGDGLVNGFQKLVGILPQGIRGILGLDESINSVKEANSEALKVFSRSLAKTGSVAESVSAAFGTWGEGISAALSPVGLLVIAVAGLYKLARDLGQEYREMSTNLGISTKQAKDLYAANLDIVNSLNNQFSTTEDILAVQKEQIGSYGIVFDLTSEKLQEMAIDLSEINKAFGYGVDTAKKMQSVFKRIGADDKLAMELQRELGFMTEMAGMSPHVIAKDLVENAEIVTTYFAGMPKEAAKATLQIRRLGLSLRKAGELAQKMLDLEGFMTDMFELAAMGGPDFSQAFEFGITGDLENMTKSIMDSIGSLDKFNQMDFLTRQKIAKTVGMTTNELAKSLLVRQKLVGLGEKEKTFVEANIDNFGDIQGMDQEAIRNRISEVDATQRLDAAWSKIKASLTKAILPAVEALVNLIDGMEPAIDIVVGLFQGLGVVIQGISYGLKLLLWPISQIGKLIEWIGDKFFNFQDSVGKTDVAFAGMSGNLQGIGKAIGVIIGSITAFKLFSGTFSGILNKIPVLGKLISRLPSGGIAGRIFGTLPKADELLKGVPKGGILSRIFGKAPTGEIQEAADGMKTVAGSQTAPKRGLFGRIFGGGQSATAAPAAPDGAAATKSVTSVAEKIQSAITGAGNVIKTAMTTFVGIIKAGINELRGVMRSMFTFVNDLIGQVSKMLVTAVRSTASILKEILKSVSGVTKELGHIFKNVLSSLSDSVASLYKGASKVVTSTIKMIAKSASKLSDAARDILENIAGAAKKIAPKLVDTTKELVSGTFKILTKVVSKLGGLIKEIIEQIVDIIKDSLKAVDKIIGRVLDIFQNVINTGLKIAGDVVGKLIDIGKSIFDGAATIIRGGAKLLVDVGKTVFEGIASIIRSGSDLLKDVVGNLVSMISGALKSIGQALGSVIQSVLKSIGDGLSSFGPKAIKGAAAMLVLSGALYVASKAMQNFANVSWEDVGKGAVTLGVLSGAALLLGSASSQMLMGALAIAALGVALVPAAYALQMFAGVDWGAIGKATVALVSLGAIAGIMSFVAPNILIGALAIAALGAALIPAAYALQMFSDVDWGGIGKAIVAITGLSAVAALLSVIAVPMAIGAAALAAVGIAMIPVAYGLDQLSKVKWDSLDGAASSILKLGGSAAILGAVAPLLILGSVGLMAFGMSAGVIASGMDTLSGVDWGVLNVIGSELLKFSSSIAMFGLSAPLMIAGAVSIGVLSAALIPFASAVKMMSGLDFDGIESGFSILGSSIISLGKSVALLGLMSPFVMTGSLALTALGYAVSSVSIAIGSALSYIDSIVESLTELESLDGSKLAGIGTGLLQLGTGLAGLAGGGIVTGIAQLLGGDPFKKLEQLAEIANPLDIAARAINMLGESLMQLSNALETIDLSKLSDLNALKGFASQVGIGFQMRRETGKQETQEPSAAMTAQNVSIAEPQPPVPSATGQNVSIRESSQPTTSTQSAATSIDDMLDEMTRGGGTSKLEALMIQLIKVVQESNNRPMVFEFDDGTVRHIRNKTRSLNNNR